MTILGAVVATSGNNSFRSALMGCGKKGAPGGGELHSLLIALHTATHIKHNFPVNQPIAKKKIFPTVHFPIIYVFYGQKNSLLDFFLCEHISARLGHANGPYFSS